MTHEELVAAYADLLQRIEALEEHATRPKAKRGSRIPEPFNLTAEMRKWAAQELPGVDVIAATRNFVDYWRAIPGKNGCKLDWPATWRNGVRLYAQRTHSGKVNGSAPRTSRFDELNGGSNGQSR